MTSQATNSIALYKGGNPTTITALLQMQSSSVVKELMEHFRASDIHELAVKLSIG